MLPQQRPKLRKGVLKIQEEYQISGGVHALQITVLAVIQAVHDAGGIVKVLVPEALADRCPGIDEISVFLREDQLLAAVLQLYILLPPVKHILIVSDRDQLRLRVMSSDLLRLCPPEKMLFHINMGEAGQQCCFRTGIAFGMHPVPPFLFVGPGRAGCRFRTKTPPRPARAVLPG